MSPSIHIQSPQIGIAHLIITHPLKRNALTQAMWRELCDVLNNLSQDKTLKVLIVEGAGAHFSSGADISEFPDIYASQDQATIRADEMTAGFQALSSVPVPTIAKIKGMCVGGGCGLAVCCDIRIADNTARFAITPAKLGLVYPYPEMVKLIHAVGLAHARDLLLTARQIKAKHAERIGLITERCKPDDLDDCVDERAKHIMRLSRDALIDMKHMLRLYQNGQSQDTPETQTLFVDRFQSEDFKKGCKAFLGKSTPAF